MNNKKKQDYNRVKSVDGNQIYLADVLGLPPEEADAAWLKHRSDQVREWYERTQAGGPYKYGRS